MFMAKSRFRYWLSVALSIGLFAAFFKIGANSAQHAGTPSAPAGGTSIQDSLFVFEPGRHDAGYILTSFVNAEAHDSAQSAEPAIPVEAQQAWEWMNAGTAVLLDLRGYDDYQAYHPKGARSFSAGRLADLETVFPDQELIYIFLQWGTPDLAVLGREFRRRGYLRLGALDMHSSRPGFYKMNEWEREQLPIETKNAFQFGDVKILLEEYALRRDSLGFTRTLAHFPKPTVELLLQYRPQIIEHFGFDEVTEEFLGELGEIESVISTAVLADNKIWVGFSFYEGEKNKGYGGIGFYDLQTGAIGVLRHPALVNHSVRDLMVTDEMIYIATIDEFELSREAGNGLVMIDRKTLQVHALTPPGTSVVWHRDGGETAALFYDKSIPEILQDHRFVPKTNIEGWNPNDLITALNLGLERYMIATAEQELKSAHFNHSFP